MMMRIMSELGGTMFYFYVQVLRVSHPKQCRLRVNSKNYCKLEALEETEDPPP